MFERTLADYDHAQKGSLHPGSLINQRPMKLTINGEARELEGRSELTVLGLLETIGVADMRVAVEINGAIVRRARWETAVIVEGDAVEVVQFVGGGS